MLAIPPVVVMFAVAFGWFLRARPATTGDSPPLSAPTNPACDEIRRDLIERVVTMASDTYEENARITSILDDKAQKTAQTAGVFLAAGFAFMKPVSDSITKFLGKADLYIMASAVALLLGSVAATLLANWLRRIPAPLNPDRVREMALKLAELSDQELTPRRELNFLHDMATAWIEILAKQQQINTTKARFVRGGQIALGLAIMLVGLLLILVWKRAIIP